MPSDQQDGDSLAQQLAEVARDCPGWEPWEGVAAGLLYARRTLSSPPRVVRAYSPEGLRRAIKAEEAIRRHRM